MKQKRAGPTPLKTENTAPRPPVEGCFFPEQISPSYA